MGAQKDKVLNGFYYLAPLWFVLEVFFWPNLRAGVVFGPGIWGTAAFYSIEAALGASFWFKLPYANVSALVENILYLIFALKFILLTPLDIALTLGDGTANAEAAARNYPAALPGIIYSAWHVVYKIQNMLHR